MASMNVMREYVSRQYGGGWPEKVKKMPDIQILAIYHKMIRDEENLKRKQIPQKITETEVRGGRQLSFLEDGRKLKIKEAYIE